jgi:chemotaxis protein MotB
MGRASKSAGNWLTTYSDFITLMMIFFIVLYQLTPGIKKKRFEMIIGAFQGKESVFKGEAMIDSKIQTIQNNRAKNWQKLKNYVKKNDLNDEVQVKTIPGGIKIILGEGLTFNSGSAQILDKAKVVLKEISDRIDTYTGTTIKEVDIQGHTDNVPISSTNKQFHNNWELGAARATSVLEFITAHTHIPLKKYKASTYGEYHPIDSNSTRAGRRKNRRVEIYVRYNKVKSKKNTFYSIPKRTNK